MSDEERGRGGAAWLRGEVSLRYFVPFVYIPEGNYMYFMFAVPGREDWVGLQARKDIRGVAMDQKDWNSIINSDSFFYS